MAISKSEQKGYATLDPNFLCGRCASAHIMHGPGGKTEVECSQLAKLIKFVVTDCNRFQPITMDNMLDKEGMVSLQMEDGHICRRTWSNLQGQTVWVRCVDDKGRLLTVEEGLKLSDKEAVDNGRIDKTGF